MPVQPFHTTDENYMAQVNMVFGSFNLHDEFFAKHQLNYLADIVRILHYTGVAFTFLRRHRNGAG